MSSPESIAAQFDVPGRIVTLQRINEGNVNDTFRVVTRTTFSEAQFILQRINKIVFRRPELVMANMKAVTDHAHRRIEAEADGADRIWQLPRVLQARGGGDYVIDADGQYWRGLSMIASATSYDKVKDVGHAWEAGHVLGHFQRIIADYPARDLEDTLPGFHITPRYLRAYDEVLATPGARQRLDASAEARRIAAFIEERRGFAAILEDALARGELMIRPIHGDPKITNIMIDDITGKGTAIVDLDTVKPGLVHYDFGDCVRSVCNPAGEETRDLGEVTIDAGLFEALVRGYLDQAGGFLTAEDRRYLYDSARLIAFELGLRFFADYLAGNVYFKTNYEDQNLNRSRVQMKVCERIEESEPLLRRVLEGV